MMINRFNNIDSKEWLPYQKSWFKFSSDEELYRKSIRFFMKFDSEDMNRNFFFWGSEKQEGLVKNIAQEEAAIFKGRSNLEKLDHIQFAIIDLRGMMDKIKDVESWLKLKDEILDIAFLLKYKLYHRRFLSIIIPNYQSENQYFPFAWDLAKTLSHTYSLKDEKIACLEISDSSKVQNHFHTDGQVFYQFFFRSDEKSADSKRKIHYPYFDNQEQLEFHHKGHFPSWFILKPKARKRKEILHPSKFPEELADLFLNTFSKEKDVILDPMCGSGSTIVSSILNNRNAFGIELSEFFSKIADERCHREFHGELDLFEEPIERKNIYRIHNKDIREVTKAEIPLVDYLFSSPPNWNILNMKGAENQTKRIKKGLMVNYSDPESDVGRRDLGNIEDYHEFIEELSDIYIEILDLMRAGAVLTIIVKNIKKQGSNYPFAWDIAEKLMAKTILLPESFWLQDDISIAPFGYGNTFVSNTFHQYCLSFMKR